MQELLTAYRRLPEGLLPLAFGPCLLMALLAAGCAGAPPGPSSPRLDEVAAPIPEPPIETPPPAESFELVPGVIVDPARSAVYSMRPRGGLEGLDLESGEPLWASTAGAKPLAEHQGRLLVQVEAPSPSLFLTLLDTAGRELGLGAIEASLPQGVRASIDDTSEGTFTVEGRVDGDFFLLSWSFLRVSASGVDAAARARPARLLTGGTLRLDPATGGVATAPAGELGLPVELQGLLFSREILGRPWLVGPVYAAIVVERAGPGERRIVLRRWTAENVVQLQDRELFEGPVVAARRSADGRHLLVSSPLQAEPDGLESYRWRFFSAATGQPAGELTEAASTIAFSIQDAGVLWVGDQLPGPDEEWVGEPPWLRLVALETGEVLWSRPVRNIQARERR